MPDPRTTHPDYDAMAPTWRKLRDAATGRDALMRGGELYLPKPDKMSAQRYLSYIKRAKWFNATRRTVQAFEGLAFREVMAHQVPKSIEEHLSVLTTTGVSLQGLAKLAFRETMLMGRYGVLVDYDASADRPFWAGYPAERILNWQTERVNGQERLTQLSLRETAWTVGVDGYTLSEQEAVRVLRLVDGVYTQTLYILSNGGVQDTVDLVAQRRNVPMDFIPFVLFSPNDLEVSAELSPLNDLVDTNLAYWRHSADYEWALHLTASPTPWITGHNPALDVDADGKPATELVLGSDTAIVLTEPEARIGILEFQGLGMGPLRDALTDDKLEMASLGARLLEGAPQSDETLGAFQLRQIGDTSVIASLAQALSLGLSRLLQAHAYWFGASADPQDTKIMCHLAPNFTTTRLDPQTLTALMAGLQAGHISQETFYYNLQQGELAEPGVDFEQERARIEAQAPAMVRLLPGQTNPDQGAA